MYQVLQVVATMLVAAAMVSPLAHALEMPGKRRLDRETYLAVQAIYYPGFTIAGGVAEAGGLVAAVIVLVGTPPGTVAFWSTAIAVAGLLSMFVVYVVITHPVNKVWLKDEEVTGVSAWFFAAGTALSVDDAKRWTALRDRWEHSHVARAVLSALSTLAMLVALQQ